MSRTPEILGLIQARSGSKGVPDKNVRPLLGKPLMAWMLESAKRSQVTRLILSTDSPAYAEIGRSFGAETPFLRPKELAADNSTDWDVVSHALTWLKDQEGYQPNLVLRLQPTNPTFPTHLIDAGIQMLLSDPEADSVRPITPTPKHPCKMWTWESQGNYLKPFVDPETTGFQEPYNIGRNQLPAVYAQVGAMEVIKIQTLLEKKTMAGSQIRGLLVEDPLWTVNIDSELDFLLAEAALKILLEQNSPTSKRKEVLHGSL